MLHVYVSIIFLMLTLLFQATGNLYVDITFFFLKSKLMQFSLRKIALKVIILYLYYFFKY